MTCTCGSGEEFDGNALNSPLTWWDEYAVSFAKLEIESRMRPCLKQLLRGVCRRPEPLRRVQLHSILIHPETHADMCEIKIVPHVGFNKEQQDKSPTDASDLSLGLWAFHGNVNFPLTLIWYPSAVNNSPIEIGQCPLAASGEGAQGWHSHYNLLLFLGPTLFAV